MKIELSKFGEILMSRPAGKDAYLTATAYLFKPLSPGEEIVIDFSGVKVIGPSWADEFITPLKKRYKENHVSFINTENPSVKATLAAIS
jgi:anti-anti-sigma regulatory factor